MRVWVYGYVHLCKEGVGFMVQEHVHVYAGYGCTYM